MRESGIVGMLTTTVRTLAHSWPALLAWFLAGWTARLLILRFAGWVGNDLPLLGQLILPLAVIARLASYVAMFLVLRDALPNAGQSDAAAPRESFLRRWGTAISAAILPFFVIYAAWGMVAEDERDYAAAALDQRSLDATGTPLDVSISVLSLSIVVVAFGGRWLLQRFAAKLPRWTAFVSAYLEAVWVLVAALILRTLLAGVPAWLATRRMFAPVDELIAALRSQQPWFRVILDAVGEVMALAGDVLFQPLAWVAVVGIVLGGGRAGALRAGSRLARARDAMLARWKRVSPRRRRLIAAATGGVQERWLPIVGSVRLVWTAGAVTLSGFLLCYALLGAAEEWGVIAVLRLLGPHEITFWMGADTPVTLLLLAITVPMQLALVASVYDTALGRALSAPEPAASAEPEAAPQSS